MPYKLLLLDWYRTLSDSLFWEGSEHRETIESAMLASNSALLQQWMRGKLTAEQAVEIVCDKTGLDRSVTLRQLIASCEQMTFNESDIIDDIQQLRNAGTRVYIATDNTDTFVRWTAPALSLHDLFDGIIDSYSRQALKDDFKDGKSLFFADLLASTGIAPSHMLLIDDRPDAAAVERIGIRFYHFDRTRSLSEVLGRLLP